ncbi:extracellular solute-binding protein [Agromyces cerinus]|uniref:Multiple sugar transport system substrate-binding protein n=1 Tax=Agromyces cerinus subsp. cerinus TaxID=232089 RepID=A0A1N6E7Z6_9MICO|nr:extracellular solute-binding protein [Agromyces cerinus]SIN79091.1 multiple sugar transport system substrate-binding protein [Agromyces cerinus subsp. cerinus]
MKRSALALACIATIAVAATGCAAEDSSGTTNITFAHWGNNQEAATLKAMVAAFEDEHPDIDVELNWIQSDYEQKLQTSIAGGQAPTISQMSNTSLPGFAAAYQTVEVDPSDYYSENFAASMKYDGEYKAIPFVAKPKVMAVNGALFDAKGLERPAADAPMTTDEFAATAEKLTEGAAPDKIYGSARLWYNGWLNAMGGSFYSADGTSCLLDEPVAADTADFIIDAQAPDGYAPTQLDAEGQDMFDWLSIGRLAMQPDFGPWDIAKLAALDDADIELVPVPGGGAPMEINGLGISADASGAELEAALTFAEFVSTAPEAQDLLTSAESSLGVPVVEESIDSFLAAAPELNLNAFIVGTDQSTISAAVAKDPQIRAEFDDAIYSRTALGSGSEDPAVVLAEFNETCQSILDGE